MDESGHIRSRQPLRHIVHTYQNSFFNVGSIAPQITAKQSRYHGVSYHQHRECVFLLHGKRMHGVNIFKHIIPGVIIEATDCFMFAYTAPVLAMIMQVDNLPGIGEKSAEGIMAVPVLHLSVKEDNLPAILFFSRISADIQFLFLPSTDIPGFFFQSVHPFQVWGINTE